MENSDLAEMSVEERDDFLSTGGTGVLSFSQTMDDPPYSVPVSYGYDPRESVFYFRLAAEPDSGSGELTDRAVSFVTYGHTDDGWQSVVAMGRLARTSDENVSTQSLEGLKRVTIPFVDIFDRPLRQVSFEFYRLDPDELHGRTER